MYLLDYKFDLRLVVSQPSSVYLLSYGRSVYLVVHTFTDFTVSLYPSKNFVKDL